MQQIYCTLRVFQPSLEASMWGQCYDVSRQLVQRGEARFYYYTPSPLPMRAVSRKRGHAFAYSTSTTSYPSRSRWTDMQQWIRHCKSSSSNIIVRLLEEAKSQAQTECCSCEHWSTHIARLLHETKLLCEPTIVLVRTTTC